MDLLLTAVISAAISAWISAIVARRSCRSGFESEHREPYSYGWNSQIALNESQVRFNASVQNYMTANTESIKAIREIISTQTDIRANHPPTVQ